VQKELPGSRANRCIPGAVPARDEGEQRKTIAVRRRSPSRAKEQDAGPFEAEVGSFWLHLAAEGKAGRTLDAYTEAVRWFAAAHLLRETGKTRWEQVDRRDLQRWTVWLLGEYSTAYASNQFRAVRRFLRWLAFEEDRRDPTEGLRAPKVTAGPVPVFSSGELSALRRACQGRSFATRRDSAVIEVLLATGVRRSELAGIRYHPDDPARCDLRLLDREITVRGKGGRERVVRIGFEAARSLDRYLRARARHPQAGRPQLWLARKPSPPGHRTARPPHPRAPAGDAALAIRRAGPATCCDALPAALSLPITGEYFPVYISGRRGRNPCMTTVPKAPRLRADASRNRERIIIAAREVLTDHGADAPLDEIARRAGIGNATVYRHFASRDVLIRHVVFLVVTEVTEIAERLVAEDVEPAEALRAFAHASAEAHLGVWAVNPKRGLDKNDPEISALRKRHRTALEEILKRGRQAGRVRADIGAGDVMVLVCQVARPLPDTDRALSGRLVHRHIDLLVDGLTSSDPTRLDGKPVTLDDLNDDEACG
jgi:site-specific recombinase XerD/AcrR family transcriptional regulator